MKVAPTEMKALPRLLHKKATLESAAIGLMGC
jgi:hypothetical protein